MLAGQTVHAACTWGLLAAAARLGTPEAAGRLALALAVAAPVFTFFNLNLRGLLVTDAENRYRFAEYLAVRGVTTLMAFTAVSAAGWVVYEGTTAQVILWVAVARVFHAAGELFQARHQRLGHMDRAAVSQMLRGALPLGALAAGLHLGGLTAGAAGMAAASLAVWLGWDLVSSQKEGLWPRAGALPGSAGEEFRNVRWSSLREMTVSALPLGGVVTLVALYSYLPRFFVERWAGAAELGVFAAMAQLRMAGNLAIAALGQSASPRLARLFLHGRRVEFRALGLRMLAAAALLGLGGIAAAACAGNELLAFVYGPEYAARSEALVWLMLAGLFEQAASVLGYVMTAARRIRPQAPIALTAAGTLTAGLLFLVPGYGGFGAAIALAVAMAVNAALYAVCAANLFRRVPADRPRSASA